MKRELEHLAITGLSAALMTLVYFFEIGSHAPLGLVAIWALAGLVIIGAETGVAPLVEGLWNAVSPIKNRATRFETGLCAWISFTIAIAAVFFFVMVWPFPDVPTGMATSVLIGLCPAIWKSLRFKRPVDDASTQPIQDGDVVADNLNNLLRQTLANIIAGVVFAAFVIASTLCFVSRNTELTFEIALRISLFLLVAALLCTTLLIAPGVALGKRVLAFITRTQSDSIVRRALAFTIGPILAFLPYAVIPILVRQRWQKPEASVLAIAEIYGLAFAIMCIGLFLGGIAWAVIAPRDDSDDDPTHSAKTFG